MSDSVAELRKDRTVMRHRGRIREKGKRSERWGGCMCCVWRNVRNSDHDSRTRDYREQIDE